MHSRFSGLAVAVCLGVGGLGLSLTGATAWAQPKNKKAASETGTDKSFEKQSAWEQKVMGEDGGKKADMKKIAAAQKLAEEARKNPPPEPVVHHKDPNKEGARAKREASIGLPIESEEAAAKSPGKKTTVAKKAEPNGSANDELGALVAASLAGEKSGVPSSSGQSSLDHDRSGGGKGHKSKGRGKAPSAKADPPSSLDRMFSNGH
jgi:hypothetical protein